MQLRRTAQLADRYMPQSTANATTANTNGAVGRFVLAEL